MKMDFKVNIFVRGDFAMEGEACGGGLFLTPVGLVGLWSKCPCKLGGFSSKHPGLPPPPIGSKAAIPYPQSGAAWCARDERDRREREQPVRQ